MGVADNKSYKDQYHFRDDRRIVGEDYPSIEGQPKINQTIKENPYRSNVEIEGGEIVLQPDLTAIFKAVGKKHKSGGMDVLLKPNSFIFSDDKTLALTEEECELFELKKTGGKHTPEKYTPAEVVKKNVNPKHYNTLINNIGDPFKDDLARKSSAMMLEKYIGTLGNIAFVQEQKKMFPDGLPDFSIGSAPVYDQDLKNKIDENKQYMKYGGHARMQLGGWRDLITPKVKPKPPFLGPYDDRTARYRELDAANWDKLSEEDKQEFIRMTDEFKADPYRDSYDTPATFKTDNEITPPSTQAGVTTATGRPPAGGSPAQWGLHPGDKGNVFQNIYGKTNAADKLPPIDRISGIFGYDGPKNNKDFQKWLYNKSSENKAVIDKWHQKYSKGPTGGKPSNGDFDGFLGTRWQGAMKELLVTRPPAQTPKDFTIGTPTVANRPGQIGVPPAQLEAPTPDAVEGDPQGYKRADWKFTPWQKISQLYNWGQYANVKRYMPYRSRFNATFADPSLLNPEQTIGDMKGLSNQQLKATNSLNPVLANSQRQGLFGQFLNQVPGVRSQYDNQNAQIKNQFTMYNNQVKNNESMVNMGNDQNYYMQAIEGRKNFDNMRTHTANNAMNNVLRDVETNQTLAYNLLTQNNPAYGYDWDTGHLLRNKKDIRDVASNPQSDILSGIFSEYLQDPAKFQSLDPRVQAALIKSSTIKGLPLNPSAPNFLGKKGGKVPKNPYKY